jgi:hypothetical protein
MSKHCKRCPGWRSASPDLCRDCWQRRALAIVAAHRAMRVARGVKRRGERNV